MLKFITPSEDYLNDWRSTREFSIYSIREFRKSIEGGDNEIKNHEALEAVRIHDSLHNLQTPNAYNDKDLQTVLKAFKSRRIKGEKIPSSVQSYLDKVQDKIIEGKSPDVAYGLKGEVSGGSGLDKTNPPPYIFQLTDAILNKGISLHRASIQVSTNKGNPSQKHMYMMFQEEKSWRLQGYVRWRHYQLIDNKTDKLDTLNEEQMKYLKKYWGWDVFRIIC